MLFGAIAAGPVAIWLARNVLLGAPVAGGRNFGTHIVSWSVLENGLTHLASWFLPLSLSGPASGGLLLCGVTLLIIFAVKACSHYGANTKSHYFIFVFSIFVLAYVAFLMLSFFIYRLWYS